MSNVLFSKILVPVDFSPCSREAFRMAIQMGKMCEAEILLLHVVDTKALDALNALGLALPSEEKLQKKKLRHHARSQIQTFMKMEEAKGVPVIRQISEGKPFVEIVRTARTERVDLVVLGSYGGQTGDVGRIFFGSTAEQVVRTANCPVLCVPFPYRKPEEPKIVKKSSPKS